MQLYNNTPLIESPVLSALLNAKVYLKMESMQPTGSFKDRGISALCKEYLEKEGTECFVTSSGGNAGLAAAHAGMKLGVRVRVIVPKTTLNMMIQKIEQFGAAVEVEGESWAEADIKAREVAKNPKHAYIPPFDHPTIWKGHSTIIDEIKAMGIIPDAMVVSVGGGGLFAGVIEGIKRAGWNTTVYTAETEGAASFYNSIRDKKRVTLSSINTIAVTLGAKTICEKAFEYGMKESVVPLLVSDKQAVKAVKNFVNDHRVLTEPACGASLALAYDKKIPPGKHKTIVIVVCGGSGTSLELIKKWDEILL